MTVCKSFKVASSSSSAVLYPSAFIRRVRHLIEKPTRMSSPLNMLQSLEASVMERFIVLNVNYKIIKYIWTWLAYNFFLGDCYHNLQNEYSLTKLY